MKKIVSLVLVVFCIFSSLTVFSSAAEKPMMTSHIFVDVSTDAYSANTSYYKNMIRNPYYQKYYNELINYSCQLYYKLLKDTDDNSEYISFYAKEYLDLPENCATLIFREPSAAPESITEYNRSILEKYFEKDEILYISDYDYAAIICIADVRADVVNNIEELEYIGDAFFTNYPGIMMPMTGTYALGDVFNSDDLSRKVNASDARFLLRYAAGLETVGADKAFYFCADMNFDNKIDAADARLALRTAAGLEEMCYVSYSYFQFWDDYMGVIKNEK